MSLFGTKIWHVSFLPRKAMHSAVMREYVVCLSVCLSVCDVVFHTGWNTSKIISQPNSLRLLLGLTPTRAIWSTGRPPKLGWNRGEVRSTKTCNISETVQDRTKVTKTITSYTRCHAIAGTIARCAQRKISRRLRKNRHITILSLFGGEIIFEVFSSNVIRVAKRYRRTDRRTIYCGITDKMSEILSVSLIFKNGHGVWTITTCRLYEHYTYMHGSSHKSR